ncbi:MULTISPECIES: purple acid phosphatase family protein [Streptomyces]|uniref:purple acid phosphatase family protein n=1 Tax=Streptomyces TaxID=1883 RepID=UPI0013719A0A|nr:metallophosphoesterase family protein [Streptomyces sp. SID2888]MYV50523.1 metallophosphoesterase [Streptomyces sp. SID2888]
MNDRPSSQARGPVRRRVATGAGAAFLGLTVALGGGLASPAGAAETSTLTGIILGVGANESQRTVTWYSSADTAQKVQLAPTAQLVNGEFPAGAATFDAIGGENIATSGGYNRHATLTGLKEHTQYSYRVGSEGNWSSAYSFKTQDFEGDYDFLFFGDPQIGSSGNVAQDQAGWQDTLDVALKANPDTELLVSGGDQVETANTESQWDAFLAPDKLRQYPWAATIGNHDVGGKAYEQHMFTPNTDRSASLYQNGNPASNTSGGDYWYIYKDVLFIDINSNSYANPADGNGGDAAHIKYITDVINKHGSEAKWKVLNMHHAMYSPASHAKDSDLKSRRGDLPETFSKLGIDLVLAGHDHAYSRSYVLKNGEKQNKDEQPGAANVYPGPGGVVYVTGNSASGSKYYAITSPDNSGTTGTGMGADPLNPKNYWFNSAENQENKRSYVKVEVRNDQLVVKNVRSEASPSGAVGSVIDDVTVHPYHGDGQQLQVNVPDAPAGEFGWTIDGYNGLVDLGTAKDHDGDYFQADGRINPILVSDNRRSLAPWSISASVGDFKDADKTFSGAYLGWTPNVLEDGAGAKASGVVASGYDDHGAGLSVSRGLGWADQGHPKGKAKLGADLDLKIPGSVNKGAYRATLTITALSS